jgi:hypothetical protein
MQTTDGEKAMRIAKNNSNEIIDNQAKTGLDA